MEFKIGKVIKKLVIAFIITIFLFGVIVALNDFQSTMNVLKSANIGYLGFAFILLCAFMIFNIYVLFLLLRSRGCRIPAKDLFLVGATEPFFNGITPFSTGGQPFQAYALYKMGVSLEDSTTALMMNFIIYMVPTNIFALISLIFFQKFVENIPGFVTFALLGFAINFAIVVFVLSCAFSKSFRFLMTKLVMKLSKTKLLGKFLKGKTRSFNSFLSNVQKGCNALLSKPKTFAVCIIAKVLSLVAYYSIPFAFIRALHVDIPLQDIFYIMFGTSFAITMVVFVPTPGSAGGIELAFKAIFATVAGVTPAIASGGMVLWRLFTYYFLMIVGFIAYLVFEMRFDRKKNIEQDTEKT